MRYIYIICFTFLFALTGQAQTKRTIDVATAGTLSNYISESEKYTIEELTLTGNLNGTDFRLLRDMAGNNYKGEITQGKLKVLDLTNAKVVAGGEKYLDTDEIAGSSGGDIYGSFHCTIETSNVLPQHVFACCEKLALVSIPNSVTNIGWGAFSGCSGLTFITIPNSVTSIGSGAFQNCSALTSITIPNSVTNIGDGAFWDCSGLTSITIPNSVTFIGFDAFRYCNKLASIKSEIVNPFEIGENTFSTYTSATLTVPAGTKSKYQATNYWNKFTNIVERKNIVVHNGDDLKSIIEGAEDGAVITVYGGSYYFYNVVNEVGSAKVSKTITIKAADISDRPTIYGRFELFDGAGMSLEGLKIDGSLNAANNDQIFKYKFENAAAGSTFAPLDVQNCEITGRSDSEGLLYLNIQAIVEAITFNNCIIHGIECYGGDFIDSRSGLPRTITLTNSTFYTVATARDFIRVDDASGSFAGAAGPVVTVDHCTLYNVGAGAANYRLLYVRFVGNELIFTNNIVVGTTYKRGFTNQQKADQNPTLQNNYYFNCENLTSAGAGADATISWFDTGGIVGNPGFRNPNNGDFTLDAGSAANRGGAGDPRWIVSTSRTINVATAGTLSNYISDSEKYTIEELTLTGNLNGTDFRLLRDMAGNNYKGEITEGKLKVLDLTGAKIVAGGEKYLDTDKIYYNNNSSSSTGSWHLTVDYANMLPQSVFEACEKLTSVSVPNTVTSIEYYAFKNCNGLTSITIPASVTSIGSWAFSNCASLASITIPSTVTEIGANPFGYCSALSAVSVQSGNTKYDSRNNCNAIIETSSNKLITGCKNTVIPATVTRIGDTAFGGCTGLTSVTFPNSVTSIDDFAFQMCTRLGSVTLPNALTTIGQFAFYGCTDLTAITIPGSVTSIGDFAFNLCLDLNAVTSEIVNPFAISDMVFSTYSSATLTVPSGTKSKYLATSGWNKFATIEEKLNDGEVVFLADNIEYKGNKNTQKAAVQSVENSLTQVVIPASVTYGGQTYQVTSIADDILSNRTFSYVSLPSTITSISSSTFRGSTLGALIWNADATLSSGVFSNMSNRVDANFLLYVNNQSYAPSNVKNVVVDNTASSITLADAKNTMFYCPRAFTATTITYKHHYSMETGGSGKGWESISLPFDVQKIEHATKGELTPFASYNPSYSNQRPFWLYEMGSSGFRRTSTIKANTPYIISMPNNSAYDEEYILTGDVTFSASNATVPVTSPVRVTAGTKTFVPAFATVDKSSAVYPLNVTNSLVTNTSAYDPGSRFVSDLRVVYPFEAYMTTSSAGAPYLSIEFDDNEATRISSIDNGELTIDNYYTLDGVRHEGKPTKKGVYIINGKKVVIK